MIFPVAQKYVVAVTVIVFVVAVVVKHY